MDARNIGAPDGPMRWSRTTRFEWRFGGEGEEGAGAGRGLPALTGGPIARPVHRPVETSDHLNAGEHRLLIREIATRDQRGDQVFFDPLTSALSLRVTCEVSPGVVALPTAYFTAHFLILDASTGGIVVHKRWSGRLEWGTSFWLAMGNHWGPAGYDTPVDWGLSVASPGASGVYGFRAAMSAEAWLGEHRPALGHTSSLDLAEFAL